MSSGATGPKPAASGEITPKQKKILEELGQLSFEELVAMDAHVTWQQRRHNHQKPPQGEWTIWLLLAGRGAGKTRAAAEWLWWHAFRHPGTRWLVSAPTAADVRDTCFEGDSGLLTVMPNKIVKDYNRSLNELILINGSLIKGISAETPDRLRGPQFHGGGSMSSRRGSTIRKHST
jgi:phage terminase large subunit-like protein